MKIRFSFFIGIAVEIFLFIVIFFLLVLGLVGALLPAFPGLVAVGLAAGLYSLMVKSKFARLTPMVNRHVVWWQAQLNKIPYYEKTVVMTKELIQRYREKVRRSIIRFGLILLGFNVAMVLCMLFCFIVWMIVIEHFAISAAYAALGFQSILFLISAACALAWYRTGQVMAAAVVHPRLISSFTAVAISVMPLVVFALCGGVIGAVTSLGQIDFFVALLYGAYATTLLASIFEFFIVHGGMTTRR